MATVDTGESYQPLQEATALAAGFLVDSSFGLDEERILVLGRARNYVALVAELYEELDDQFDFFISTNELSGDEMIELPIGFQAVYYV